MAAALCAVLDTRYKILLAAIRGALSRNRTVQSDIPIRGKYADWAIEEMLGTVKALSHALVRLPCKDGGDVARFAAGPTFTLGDFSLPDDAAGIDVVIRDLHKQSEDAVTAALGTNPDALSKTALDRCRQMDQSRVPNP